MVLLLSSTVGVAVLLFLAGRTVRIQGKGSTIWMIPSERTVAPAMLREGAASAAGALSVDMRDNGTVVTRGGV